MSTTIGQTKIIGRVQDENGHPIDSAIVKLKNVHFNSSIVLNHGSFVFNGLHDQRYTLEIGAAGYFLTTKNVQPSDTLLVITLNKSTKKLREITVTANSLSIERKAGKVIFNVNKSIVLNGSNTWEAINRIPGVQSSFQGDITASGKSVVVYLDQRPIRLAGNDLTAFLKSLPANTISKIEVIYNPGSQYDAEGGAVINVVSKKHIAQGLNTSVNTSITQSSRSSYAGNLLLNYRKNKFNLYGNLGVGYDTKKHLESEYIVFDGEKSYSFWNNQKSGLRNSRSLFYRFGADYDITNNAVVGFLINGSHTGNFRVDNVSTSIRNDHKVSLDSLLQTKNNSVSYSNLYSANLNYKLRFDSLGNGLNIDADYVPYVNNSNQRVSTKTFLSSRIVGTNPIQIQTPSNQIILIESIKGDLSTIISKGLTFHTGLKFSHMTTSNRINKIESFTSEKGMSNQDDRFDYKENIQSFYTTFNWVYKKLEIDLGVRLENSITKSNSISLDSVNRLHYLKAFPSVAISYNLDENNQLTFNLNTRINRPEYYRLNPFIYYSSPYTYIKGNPYLKSALISNYEIGYTLHNNYNFTFLYHKTNDLFSNVTVQDNNSKIFYDTQENLGTNEDVGFNSSNTIHPFPFCELNTFVQWIFRREKSNFLNGSYFYRSNPFSISENLLVTLNKAKGFVFELNGWFNSASIEGIYRQAGRSNVSCGISKQLFKKQGSIRLSFNDIFYNNDYNIHVRYLNQNNGFHEKNDTRNFSASFSYNFGSAISKARERNTASEEERNRVQ